MIDEAIGKILGMAMAYVASAMGMFVAYVNYRRRIVKADRVMTPAAWAVLAVTLVATLGGAVVVSRLAAERAAAADVPAFVEVVEEALQPVAEASESAGRSDKKHWTWVGIFVPALIFLFATVVTARLHRHFAGDTIRNRG